MKTDLYTKVVLTAIALFLGIIVMKDINFVEKANAAPSPLPMSSMSDGVIDVNIVEVNGTKINNNGSGYIPVKVNNNSYERITVEVKNDTYNKIPVEIKNGSYDKVPVEITNNSMDVKVTNYRDFK